MHCTSCGKQIADDAIFCPYCETPAPQGDELAELVAAARIGGQDVVSALYEKTYSQVYYTAKSMIKDEDAVFDIVQDTYIKAFAHLDSFQGDTKFLPWVRQIAANTARDWLKKKRPMLFTELGSGGEQDTSVEELIPDERSENLPDQVIDQKETKRLIREIIEELPEDQRAAIGMYYYEQMSVKEIAAAMGVSESAVKSRLMYGRGKIEKKVLELEKQGTKLYSLSPLSFLLLLFRNQAAYAAETPDGRILHAILASQPMGAATVAGVAQDAGTAGAAAGTEAAGGAGTTGAAGGAAAGTAGATGGLGALKIGLIALAVMTVVGLGAFGVSQIVSRSTEPQGSSSIEDVIGQKEPDEPGTQNEAEEDSQPAEGTEGSEGEDSQSAEGTEGEDSQSAEGTEGEDSQSAEGSEGEDSQFAGEAEEEAPINYIFSHMPIAAYEVTGLGIGRFESIHDEEVFVEYEDEEGGYYANPPYVRLTPGENTFVLFCIPEDVELIWDEWGGYVSKGANIHSPSGSGQWEAITYESNMYGPTLEGFAKFSRYDTDDNNYNEETYDGRIYSLVDPWLKWLRFAEIYHPDAKQNDAIYVIEVMPYPDSEDYEEIDIVLARMINAFEDLGAITVKEISVEEALERCRVVVSEGDEN